MPKASKVRHRGLRRECEEWAMAVQTGVLISRQGEGGGGRREYERLGLAGRLVKAWAVASVDESVTRSGRH